MEMQGVMYVLEAESLHWVGKELVTEVMLDSRCPAGGTTCDFSGTPHGQCGAFLERVCDSVPVGQAQKGHFPACGYLCCCEHD